ncbi:hypothetical protein SAICODRAFT_22501 [Saitoella complicata NRRL Y-17804]|nr:uncharacterized protein SAICODRAFT_22501 [Saitoella complicata NRRL Y-17804]ODQ56080.1 hypothetical protein SAICODRAFT_22501 [Saitoella complicata NRRL Y-17804]
MPLPRPEDLLENDLSPEEKPDTDEDEEDDYMNMTFEEPTTKPATETYSQRRTRIQREQFEKSQTKSQKVIEQEKREEALRQSLLEKEEHKESKAMKMMKMMGYNAGEGLGKTGVGTTKRVEPISIEMKESRTGIGHGTAVKRKLQEVAEDARKKQVVEEVDYQDRVREERELRQTEGRSRAAQRMCEALASDEEMNQRRVNVVWRGLVRERVRKERERLMREQMMERRPFHNVEDENQDEEGGSKVEGAVEVGSAADKEISNVEQEGEEEEDAELEEFEALPPPEQLDQVLGFLRASHAYCFWCGHKYENSEELAEKCPGEKEDDH